MIQMLKSLKILLADTAKPSADSSVEPTAEAVARIYQLPLDLAELLVSAEIKLAESWAKEQMRLIDG